MREVFRPGPPAGAGSRAGSKIEDMRSRAGLGVGSPDDIYLIFAITRGCRPARPGAITKFGYSRAGPVFCPDFLTGPGRAARPAALIQTSKMENGVKIENAFEY